MSNYLFVVHSSITWLMAQAIIKKHDLPPEACRVLLDRGYKISNKEYATIDISGFEFLLYRQEEWKTIIHSIQENQKTKRSLNRMLQEEVGVDYILYLPHSWSYTYWALIINPFCRQYFFLEEGTLTYNSNLKELRPRGPLLKRMLLRIVLDISLGPAFPALPQPYEHRHPKYGGCYGTSGRSFPTLPENTKNILEQPFSKKEQYGAIQQVIITGPWLENGYCTVDQYRKLKLALFQYFVEVGITVIHVKFHPIQHFKGSSLSIFREIADSFSDHIDVIELPEDCSPEEIAFSGTAKFFLSISSVAIYASRSGCKVYSYAKLMQDWPAIREVFEALPSIIEDSVTSLDILPIRL